MRVSQNKDVLAPKPVHPTAIRNHGMFGATFLNQHMVVDDRWTVGSLIDEFEGMKNLLSKRLLFNNLESKAYQKKIQKTALNLRKECRDGRTILQNIIKGNNTHAIRNFLINHKSLQRLYKKMPIQLVVENINQRTFIMRKERDRLNYRLEQAEEEYRLKLMERGLVETHIKYANEFVLGEQQVIDDFLKKVENSNVRLKAITAINSTYKKIIQILKHDEIFYEPILRSLTKDIEDQANFIKHILYLGMPAISRFKQLNEDYKRLESRKSSRSTVHTIANFGKVAPKVVQGPQKTTKELVIDIGKRYTRETSTMLKLKNDLEEIETVIKQIKMATLCSHAKEIYPRMKTQVESNFKLIKQNELEHMKHQLMAFKEKVAEEVDNVMLHNYSPEEEERLRHIQELKDQIKAEDEIEEKTLAHMKNRTDILIILRYTLWNINDILRFVGPTPKRAHASYSSSYLKLPLLKFEMLTMRAYPPDSYETNVNNILLSVQRKLRTLMDGYNTCVREAENSSIPSSINMKQLCQEYHTNFLSNTYEIMQERMETKPLPQDEEMFGKTTQNIPSRKQIKSQSAKIVEEQSKRDEK